jgi:hypothetical protein
MKHKSENIESIPVDIFDVAREHLYELASYDHSLYALTLHFHTRTFGKHDVKIKLPDIDY